MKAIEETGDVQAAEETKENTYVTCYNGVDTVFYGYLPDGQINQHHHERR